MPRVRGDPAGLVPRGVRDYSGHRWDEPLPPCYKPSMAKRMQLGLEGQLSATLRGLWFRALLPAVVVVMGYVGLACGAHVSEREVPAAVLPRLYYCLSLFVMSGVDLGTPTGGPAYARGMLWLAFFAGPTLTATALFEAIWRLAVPMAQRLLPLRDHTIVVGAGRMGSLYLRGLRERDPKASVVLVDRDYDQPRLPALMARYRPTLIIGDVGSEGTRSLLRLERARRVLLLTGNDFANLNAASLILECAPHLAQHIVLHVGNLALLRSVSHTRAARDCVFFNGHQIAAQHLVCQHLARRFASTDGADTVVLAGFGTFGQSVLHALQEEAAGGFAELFVVDRVAAQRGTSFSEQVGFAGDYEHHLISGELCDLTLWDDMDLRYGLRKRSPLIVVGTDNDMHNLECALMLRRRYADAYIVVRQFKGSPFIDDMAREANIVPFPLATLMAAAIPAAWYEPRIDDVRNPGPLLPERKSV